MRHLMHVAMLTIIMFCQSLAAGEAAPDDQALIAMANRRLMAGDLGMTMEQMFRRATRGNPQAPLPLLGGQPTVAKRGSLTAGGILPVRFRIPLKSETGEASEQVMIIDARVSRDDFGDLAMEWHYNVDQSLAEQERLGVRPVAAEDAEAALEQRMATSLKAGVFPAQVQFQGAGFEDQNKNGIGDFCQDFAGLSGDRAITLPGEKEARILTLLPKGFAEKLEKEGATLKMLAENELGFWCFVALPSRAKTVAIDASGTVRVFPGVVQPNDVAEAKRLMPTGAVYKRKR